MLGDLLKQVGVDKKVFHSIVEKGCLQGRYCVISRYEVKKRV